MKRYFRRGSTWLLIEDGLLVVVLLSGSCYNVEVFDANGKRLEVAYSIDLSVAKQKGRELRDAFAEAGHGAHP